MPIDWIAVGSFTGIVVALVSLAGVGVTFQQLRRQLQVQAEERERHAEDLRRHARLMSLQAMIPYTEKYERIMSGLSDTQRGKGFWGLDENEARTDAAFRVFLQYCNLCSEEFYLKQDVLETELWRVWEGEMKAVFISAFGRAAWKRAKAAGHFVSHGAFERQVDAWTAVA